MLRQFRPRFPSLKLFGKSYFLSELHNRHLYTLSFVTISANGNSLRFNVNASELCSSELTAVICGSINFVSQATLWLIDLPLLINCTTLNICFYCISDDTLTQSSKARSRGWIEHPSHPCRKKFPQSSVATYSLNCMCALNMFVTFSLLTFIGLLLWHITLINAIWQSVLWNHIY